MKYLALSILFGILAVANGLAWHQDPSNLFFAIGFFGFFVAQVSYFVISMLDKGERK